MIKKYILLISLIILITNLDSVYCIETIYLTQEIKIILFNNSVILVESKYIIVKNLIQEFDASIYLGLENLNTIAEIQKYAQEVVPSLVTKKSVIISK